jgi:hypothetical protein
MAQVAAGSVSSMAIENQMAPFLKTFCMGTHARNTVNTAGYLRDRVAKDARYAEDIGLGPR